VSVKFIKLQTRPARYRLRLLPAFPGRHLPAGSSGRPAEHLAQKPPATLHQPPVCLVRRPFGTVPGERVHVWRQPHADHNGAGRTGLAAVSVAQQNCPQNSNVDCGLGGGLCWARFAALADCFCEDCGCGKGNN